VIQVNADAAPITQIIVVLNLSEVWPLRQFSPNECELLLDGRVFVQSLPRLFPISPRSLEVADAIQHPKHNRLQSGLAGKRRIAEANLAVSKLINVRRGSAMSFRCGESLSLPGCRIGESCGSLQSSEGYCTVTMKQPQSFPDVATSSHRTGLGRLNAVG